MPLIQKAKVGKKGEILPKKALRKLAGLSPDDDILIIADKNEVIIQKIMSIDELLDLPHIFSGTLEEIQNLIKFQEKELERMID